MNINFDSATYNALLNRAKAEGKSIPKLVNELLITVLTKEELNDQKYQNNCLIHTCNPPKTGYIGDSGIAYSALQAGSTRTESGIK